MIEILSKTKDGLVKLEVKNKNSANASKVYYYQFPDLETWNGFYFSNSYPKSKQDTYNRTIRMSILNKIKGYLIPQPDMPITINNNSEQSNMEIVY